MAKIIIDGSEYNFDNINNLVTMGTKKGTTIVINGKTIHETTNVNIEIFVKGNVGSIDTNGAVSIVGDVAGNIDTNGSVKVGGNVGGKVDTNGRVEVGGDVHGKIDTNGKVIVNGQARRS